MSLVCYLINRVVDAWTESSVHAEDAIVDDSSEGEVVEDISAVSPYVERAILPEALIIETVDLCYLAALVVASN